MSDLPSGAVTFLFTDIEGSTDLIRQLRAGWASVLSEHQRLLRGAFDAHGGHEIDTQGDSFFYAFPSAHDAVLGAIEAQRALSVHPWPDGARVKVRMGLHTAQAAPLDGRYTGLAVHRAARISDAGHGGQILVSQATQSLLEDEAEDVAASVRDLGEQRLKGIERPVRVYQVVAPGLPTTFPPLRGGDEPSEPPLYRRPGVIAAAAVLLALVVAAAYAVASRGGDVRVSPNSVGVIDPTTGRVVGEVAVGVGPGPVAVGAGAVWVGNLDDRTLARIDPTTRKVVKTIAVQATPTAVTATPGAVWVLHGRLGIVSRVDPQFDRVVQTVDPKVGRSSGGAIDAGASGIWTALAGHTIAFVGRIDPATNEITTNGYPNGRPTAIAVDVDAVWITNGEDSSTISRIHPGTAIEVDTINVGRRPSAIDVGAGAVWVANAEDDTVSRVDPTARSSATIGVGDEPVAIAFGGGSVWVANAGDGTLSQIDSRTSEVTRTVHVGGRPVGLAFGAGSLWVAVQAP